MTMVVQALGIVGSAMMIWLAAPDVSAQSAAANTMTGAEAYREYCAGCHGRSGRGDGAVASTLKTPLPDLSALSARNNGLFPRERVKAAIANVDRPIAAHGTGEMPVWGHLFRALDRDAARVNRLLEDLTSFVETLQQPMQPTLAVGRALFEAYCATCHGPAGTGGEGPDLTAFAMRNGGVFPSARLAQVIDGRGVAAHGPRSMPVWGDAFRFAAGDRSPSAVAVRIEAVTRYLQSIQRQLGE